MIKFMDKEYDETNIQDICMDDIKSSKEGILYRLYRKMKDGTVYLPTLHVKVNGIGLFVNTNIPVEN